MTDQELRSLVESNARAIAANSQAIAQLTQEQGRLQQSLHSLMALLIQVIEATSRDRDELQGLRTEMKRVLDYLLGMQRGIG